MQNCMAWHHYPTAELWEALRSPSCAYGSKLSQICKFNMALGLTNPNENTLVSMVASWILAEMGGHMDEGSSVSPAHAYQRLCDLKEALHTERARYRAKHYGAITSYPNIPDGIMDTHPEIFRLAYPEGKPPAPTPVDEAALVQLHKCHAM